MKIQTNPFVGALLVSGLLLPAAQAGVAPYTSADADTTYLYHFSEASGTSSAANAGSTGRAALSIDGNPYAGDTVDQALITTVLGSTGFTGFGNAASLFSDACLGVDADGNGAFRPGDSAPVGPDQMTGHSTIYGVGNAFTLEAMVNVSSITGANREIICTDTNGAAADRGFQFRINTTGNLEFNAIGTTPAAAIIPIPTTGAHAFVANEWFHVALTYDGTTLRFYWTRVAPSSTTTNEIGTNTVETVELADDAILVLGNEGRSTGGLGGEPLGGLLDEVRISKVARTPSQFIFFNEGDTDNDNLQDGWEVTYFGDLTQNGSGDFDGDGFNNLAEQTAGSNPNNSESIPGETDADGLADSWEIAHFGNLNQSGDGDPDHDFATNNDEETAGTDPNSSTSFPDSDTDGLSDGWEFNFLGDLSFTASQDPDQDLYTNAEEYTAGTNPLDQLSSPDGDADGLVDGWEVLYFHVNGDNRTTLLARQDGSGDPDGDGYTNEQEETAGTNPTTAEKPTDLDTDGLIDSWEIANFNGLDEDATGNPDGDTANNLQEQNAGSDPNSAASKPGDIDGDGILDNSGAFQPYAADSHTLHLWHLDEVDQPAMDVGSNPVTMGALNGNGRLWTPSLAGFSTGLDTSLGRGSASGGALSAKPLVNGPEDDTTMSYAGADGAFTYEAIVRIDFNPAAATSPTNAMQIVTGESDASASRIWQFRLVPINGPGNTGGTTPRLEFINIHGAIGTQSLSAPLPTSGDPDAIVQGSWYHVAVSYNGSEATPDNLKLYWTLLDPSRTQANEVFSGQMTSDLISAAPDFTIGNEGKGDPTGPGSTDGFAGVIDEVRISDIARTPGQFFFTGGAGDTDSDQLPDAWETTWFGDLSQAADGDFDHDGSDNLTEYRLGLTPNTGTSRFAATIGTGHQIQWPSVTGVTFTIERSTNLGSGSWSVLNAAFAGTAGTASFTDPSPPAGKAFYRIKLNP
ncbi:LamG-like jellyroll fold domain-containing protein [Luteolibacter soli]|uniref:LamG-like jellyroll fold domain-containing protein n=1 Tax=Luteolibacter soli TaxID=3135280 RepID=A0ABU9ATI1_9BACT